MGQQVSALKVADRDWHKVEDLGPAFIWSSQKNTPLFLIQ